MELESSAVLGSGARLAGWPRSPVAAGGLAALAGATVGLAVLSIPPVALLVDLAAIAALLAILRVPMVGILVLIAVATLLPFGVIPVRVVFSPTFVDLTLTALLLGWLLRLLRRREPLATTPVDGLVLAFGGLATVSLLLGTGYAPLGGERLRLFLKLLNSVLLFFSTVQVVRSEHGLTRAVQALLLGGAAAAMIAVALYALPREAAVDMLSALDLLGYPTGPDVIRPIAGTDVMRATGTSIDPNVLGGLLMITGTLVLAQLLSASPVLPRALLLGGVLTIAVAMALTYSRSSWVGLAAGVGILAFRDRRVWLGAPIVAGALAMVPQGQTILARMASGVELRDQATLMRLGEYRDALALIARYPLFGVGFGDAPGLDLSVGVSSIYLLIAEQMGLLGLLVFLGLMTIVLGRSCQVRVDRASRVWGTFSGLQAALAAALVAGLFDHYFFNIRLTHMVALFWLLVALLMVTIRLQKPMVPAQLALQGPRSATPSLRSVRAHRS